MDLEAILEAYKKENQNILIYAKYIGDTILKAYIPRVGWIEGYRNGETISLYNVEDEYLKQLFKEELAKNGYIELSIYDLYDYLRP